MLAGAHFYLQVTGDGATLYALDRACQMGLAPLVTALARYSAVQSFAWCARGFRAAIRLGHVCGSFFGQVLTFYGWVEEQGAILGDHYVKQFKVRKRALVGGAPYQ
jgi:hypothetical protein